MTTRRGDELETPDVIANALARGGPGMGYHLPEEWLFPGPWPDAEPDYVPKPGQKRYDPRDQHAASRRPSPVNALRFSPDVGYWLSGADAGVPAHAVPDYLNWLTGGGPFSGGAFRDMPAWRR